MIYVRMKKNHAISDRHLEFLLLCSKFTTNFNVLPCGFSSEPDGLPHISMLRMIVLNDPARKNTHVISTLRHYYRAKCSRGAFTTRTRGDTGAYNTIIFSASEST